MLPRISVLLVLALCACEDRPLDATVPSTPPVNQPPLVNAGSDQTVLPGTEVVLAGSARDLDGNIAGVVWTQTGGPPVTLGDAAAPGARFTAPDGPATLAFTFTATDDDGATASAMVSVRVDAAAPAASACHTAPDPYVRREDLVAGTRAPGASLLLRFVQTTDEHIMDDDGQATNGLSPTDPLLSTFRAAMRFQDEYTDEVLNRMVQTIDDCDSEQDIEVVVATGDNTDLGTVAEVRRFIDNLDGSFDEPSDFEEKCRASFPLAIDEVLSAACTRFTGRGVADTQTVDPNPDAPEYQLLATRMALQLLATQQAVLTGRDANGDTDPSRGTLFSAPGLPQVLRCHAGEPGCEHVKLSVPYYVAFGNHDGYIRGTVVNEIGLQEATLLFGRHYMRQQHEFIDEFFKTKGTPVGHGFDHERLHDADPRNDGYYAFDAGGGKVRMIVLNTILDGTDARLPEPLRDPLRNPFGLESGTLDADQFDWMIGELDGAWARHQLVLVFSHHPDITFVEFSPLGVLAPVGVPAETIDAALASYPNVVAWVAGHTHRNRIRPFKVADGTGTIAGLASPIAVAVTCKDAEHPERCGGFWQIETASLIDWPQESRLIELYDNGDGTGTIHSALLEHDFAASKPLAEKDDLCQFYPLEDPGSIPSLFTDADLTVLCKQGGTRVGQPADRNVDLMFALPRF